MPGSVRRDVEDADAARRASTLQVQGLAAPSLGPDGSLERPFVHGTPLETRLEEGPLGLRPALLLAAELLKTLAAVHGHGILHGAVKPANIILADDGPTLVDVVAGHAADPRYLAPEQAGLVDHRVGPWSDLYGLGLVLYACVAGTPPFQGSMRDILRAHLSRPPPPLDVPGPVQAVLDRLLSKDPRERYHSAAGVRADIESILAGQAPVVGAHDIRTTLAVPGFLDREHEQRALESALDAAERGRPTLILLEAESGGGKTRLLEVFAARARQRAWVLHGQGQDQAAPRPFGLFDGVVAALRDAPRPELKAALAERAAAIGEALPELAPLVGLPDVEAGPEQHGEARSLEAVAGLLDHLGTAQRPAVLLLDDVQWADTATRRALAHWWEHATSSHLLVVAAFRAEEVPPHDLLRQWAPSAHLILKPLPDAAVADLAATMAGPLPERAVATVTRMAGGNPFLATAVLHGLVETGALEPGPDGWRIEATAFAAADGGAAVAELLLRRLRALSPSTQRVLATAAVLGKEFDAVRAAQLTAVGGPIEDVLAEACRRHILLRQDNGRFAFTHDKLREAVLASLDATERRALHLRVAQGSSGRALEEAFDVAYHFDAAGEPVRALPHALAAAQAARARFSLEPAEQYYRIAERGSRHSAADRLTVLVGLGETLMLRGSYDEARPWLQEARRLASDALAQADVDARLGDLAFKQGDLQAACAAIESALRTLGHPAPPTRLGATVRLPYEVLVQVVHSLRKRPRTSRPSAADELAIRLYSRLAHINWFLRGVVPCAWAHLREMNLSERHAPDAATANAYAEHAVVMTTVPWTQRGLAYADRALDISESTGAFWHRGQALHFGGLCLLAAGRLEEALTRMDEAMRIFRRAGDLWQAGNAGYHVALILYRLGRLEEAAQTAQRIHAQADSIGDVQNTALCIEAWAKAAGAALPEDVLRREVERCPRDDVQSWEAVQQAQGQWLLATGRLEEAEQALRGAYLTGRGGGLRSEYVSSIPAWIVTCRRRQLEALPSWDRRGRRALLAGTRRWLRRAATQARKYPNNRPHVLRETALLAVHRGHPARGQRLLEESMAAARAAGQQDEARRSERHFHRVGAPLGWPGAVAPTDAATASLALIDRFDALVDVGRGLVAAPGRVEVLASLQEAAVTLLRGTKGGLLTVRDGHVEAAGVLADEATRALQQAAPCTTSPGNARLPDGTAMRSLILAPVRDADGPGWCLYVVHDSVSGLFGPDEERLLSHLTELAGVALENAARLDALGEARDHLAVQAGLLESQAEAMEDGLLVVDGEGRMTSFNQRFRQMWGIDDDVIASRDDARAIASVLDQLEDPDEFVARIQHLYAHPEEEGRDEVRLKDGRVFERHTAPVRTRDGSLHGRIWHFRDVTSQRRSEASLRQAYRRLQELDRMKTRFINTAAHELNTPLTPIKMQVHLLQDLEPAGLTERQRRSLRILQRNADRLAALVRDILEAARLDSGRLRVKRTPIDLAVTIQESVDSFRETARQAGIRLEVDVPRTLPAEADEARMGQVFYNLLGNALRFTPEGGTVRVKASAGPDVTVRVSDTGPGMTEDQLGRLFQPFSQPVDTPKGRPAGTGLGLYICHGIAQEHGGSLEAASAGPGRGTTFTLRLPHSGSRRPPRP